MRLASSATVMTFLTIQLLMMASIHTNDDVEFRDPWLRCGGRCPT